MDYMLFIGVLERLNANGLPPSFKLDHADGEFFVEPLLFIRSNGITLSLELDSDVLCISQASGRGSCLSIG